MPRPLFVTPFVLAAAIAAVSLVAVPTPVAAQPADDFVPVTDAMLQDPDPADWPMWRRTLDGWGYSPLDQVTRENVGDLRLAWSRALMAGTQEVTPLAYDGVLYMPNGSDVIQAIDASTGDLIWEYRRDLPEDVYEYVGGNARSMRNIAIYDRLIINISDDDYAYALDATTGEIAWETEIFDYQVTPAGHSSGPIIADGRVISGRSCRPRGGPESCVVVAHDALTGDELWRRRTVPAPGDPGDETWGGVPYEERVHVGSWIPASYDPELRLIYQGTSVTSPAPKFLRARGAAPVDARHRLPGHHPRGLGGDRGDRVGARAAGRHHAADGHRRRARLCGRPERSVQGSRSGDGRGLVGDQPRLARGRFSRRLCRRRPPVRGGQHRRGRRHQPADDAGHPDEREPGDSRPSLPGDQLGRTANEGRFRGGGRPARPLRRRGPPSAAFPARPAAQATATSELPRRRRTPRSAPTPTGATGASRSCDGERPTRLSPTGRRPPPLPPGPRPE